MDDKLFQREIRLFLAIEVGKIYDFDVQGIFGAPRTIESCKVISKDQSSAGSYCIPVVTPRGFICLWIYPKSSLNPSSVSETIVDLREVK